MRKLSLGDVTEHRIAALSAGHTQAAAQTMGEGEQSQVTREAMSQEDHQPPL